MNSVMFKSLAESHFFIFFSYFFDVSHFYFFNYILYLPLLLMNHPAVLIVIFFFLNQKSEPKIVKPKSIGESILDGLKDLARWVGDKIKELLEIQVRERSWVLFKFIVKELTRPILIIAALGCWVVIYAAGVSCYLIQFSGYSCFWNFESADFFALLVQAFGKPFKSNLILGLYRSASVFLLVLVVFFKNYT